MSELSSKYRDIMNELDEKIKDKEQLDFVRSKLSEISIIFIDIIDRMSQIIEDKVIELEDGQKSIENKLSKMEKFIDEVEDELYDDYSETEIVCPYCNSEFFAVIGNDDDSEVECPECHNIIELDMNIDNYDGEIKNCSGECQCSKKCSRKKLNNDDNDDI